MPPTQKEVLSYGENPHNTAASLLTARNSGPHSTHFLVDDLPRHSKLAIAKAAQVKVVRLVPYSAFLTFFGLALTSTHCLRCVPTQLPSAKHIFSMAPRCIRPILTR